jgi:hypothetical protein
MYAGPLFTAGGSLGVLVVERYGVVVTRGGDFAGENAQSVAISVFELELQERIITVAEDRVAQSASCSMPDENCGTDAIFALSCVTVAFSWILLIFAASNNARTWRRVDKVETELFSKTLRWVHIGLLLSTTALLTCVAVLVTDEYGELSEMSRFSTRCSSSICSETYQYTTLGLGGIFMTCGLVLQAIFIAITWAFPDKCEDSLQVAHTSLTGN